MAKRVGVICYGDWRCFREIYELLADSFELRSYQGYLKNHKFIINNQTIKNFLANRLMDKKKIIEIMKWSDLTFFEWATHLLELGSHLPKRCALVTRMHRWELFEYIDKVDWQKLDKVVFVAKGMRRWFHERVDLEKNRTMVIYHEINTEHFKPMRERKEPTFKLGILGDVIPRKRIYELVLSFKELLECMPKKDLTLSIAGKLAGEYPEYIKNLIKRLNLHDNVKLEGYVPDIVEWYNNIDIIISNSMHEGSHASISEGKACGCYPIAHWWDGAEEFVPNNQLYFTNREFCDRVRAFYKLSGPQRRKIQKEMREDVIKNCALPKIVKKYEELFKSLI